MGPKCGGASGGGAGHWAADSETQMQPTTWQPLGHVSWSVSSPTYLSARREKQCSRQVHSRGCALQCPTDDGHTLQPAPECLAQASLPVADTLSNHRKSLYLGEPVICCHAGYALPLASSSVCCPSLQMQRRCAVSTRSVLQCATRRAVSAHRAR